MPPVAAKTDVTHPQPPEPIAIVGVGLRFPGGSNSLDEFEAFLREGRSGIGPLPQDRWDVPAFTPQSPEDKGKIHTTGGGFLDHVDRFDAAFFNISPKEAQYMDPQQRMLLETAWQALEHAGIDPTPLRRGDGGVYVGASSIDYALELDSLPYTELDGHLASGITMFPLSGRISYFLGWRGPSMSIDTACSSSLVALHLAAQGLRAGECEIALCGGVNAVHHPRIPVMFSNANMLSPDGRCKTFDESADGYARAEGCGVLVLKRLSDALRDGNRIHAVVRGTAVGQDGDSAGLTVPNGPAQEKVIRAALAAAHLEPADIQYVEAHGTGTPLGDPIEFGAIGDAFADSHTSAAPLLVGSVKTNLGHMEPASGLVGVIKALLQIRSATIFPHLNLTTPSGRIPWDLYPIRVPTACEPWQAPVRRAVVNSFGFAGTIGAVVLEQAPQPAADEQGAAGQAQSPAANFFTLSAKSAAALRDQAAAYRLLLAERPDVPLEALCRTGHTDRTHFPYRVAGLVADHAALDKLLERTQQAEHEGPAGLRKIAFLFSGQGSQYPGMGAALYRRHALFRELVDRCDELFQPHLGRSVRELLLGTAPDPEALNRTELTQPALFTLEYALAQLWIDWGAKPSVLIGHSIGEVVAAAVSGVLDLPDAVALVAARARLMQAVTAAGGMLAVSAPAEQVEPLLADHPDLAMAAVNSPEQCVISGAVAPLEQVAEVLRERSVRTDRLAVSHAFHSPLMTEVYEDFRTALKDITFHEPTITVVSNLTGRPARFAEIGTPEYWVRHIGEPVRFLAGIRAVAKRGRHAMIEIGPSAALTALAQRCLDAAEHLWLPSLRRRDKEGTALLDALCAYYTAGLPLSFDRLHEGTVAPARIPLPTYAFQRKRYWLPSPGPRRAAATGAAAHHPLLGTRVDQQQQDGTVEFAADLVLDDLGALADLATEDGGLALPAAAHLDLLLALQDAVEGHTRGAVEELRLHAPLVLEAENPVTVRTRLRRRPDGSAEVEVVTVVDGADRVHATARIAPDAPTATAWPAPDELGAAVLRIDEEDLHTDLASVGHPHGPRIRRLLEVTRHEDGLLSARVRGKDSTAVEQLPAELLHAALLSGVVLHPEGPVLQPRAIGGLTLHRKPRGGELLVLSRVTTEAGRHRADLLLLEDGRPVAELRGVELERPEGRAGARSFLHRPLWLRRALPPAAGPTARHVVLLDRERAHASRALDGFRAAAGAEVTVTRCADTAGLAEALREPAVTDVCWVWRPQHDSVPSLERLRAECEANYRDLLALPAALAGAAARRPPRLWLVTEGATLLPGDPQGTGGHLAAATLWGFGRVLLSEYPQYRVTLVDLDPALDAALDPAPQTGSDPAGPLAPLAAELAAQPAGEHQVALRAGRRYVRRLVAGDTAAPASGEVELRAPATGDLSDLALEHADVDAPSGDQLRVEVTAVALTAEDAAVALDTARAESGERGPVLGSLARGIVRAAGPQADHAPGTEVLVRWDGAFRSTLLVPCAAVEPAALPAGAETYLPEETGEALRTAARGTTAWVDLTGLRPAPADGAAVTVRPDRNYLVTGGLGGLGLVTAAKLVDLGARQLTLVSRSGRPTEEAAAVLAALAERAEVEVVRADVSRREDVERLTALLRTAAHPLGGIVHAAGSFDKTLIADLTWEAFEEQLAAKAYGGWLLHEAAASFPELAFFTSYSSIAAVLGGATQGHYAAAGAALDSLAEWRVRQGLPGLSVNWAAWARVGMSARLEEHLIAEIERSGVRFFSPTRALATLARLWDGPRTQRLVGEFDWDRYVVGGVEDALYDRLARQDQAADGSFEPQALAALPKPERLALIDQLVREKVADVLHLEEGDELSPNAEFLSLGLDSLMAQTVKTGLESAFRLPLPASLTYDHPTVRQLSAFLEEQLAPAAA
ncbi:SDR family oxidoreductase [Kitasatospora sp. NBC_01302]|uniref:SDR family oxidoreductase n=1 Tax=Kitasatospora sp. NBC_01302 TaxID=2903575 RepID=UPI002E147157|nr:SDR family oxidoreductase [Kitasatospora sp. NBC_01302]